MTLSVRESLAAIDPTILLMDGYDEAVIGITTNREDAPIAVYSREKCIEKLIADGMEPDDAEEFFSFNVEGAYMGPRTPLIVSKIDPE